MNVHVKLFRYDLCNFVEYPDSVGTLNLNHRVEEQLLVHVPLGVEYAVAVARFQPCGHGA